MELTLKSTIQLNNGKEMPRLGLGTFQSERGEETQNAVRWALEAGYRHIDTAAVYGNEADVGKAIRESGIPRDEIFITTKLWNDNHAYDDALRAYEHSIHLLGVEQVDLYLVHWPIRGTRQDAWRALLKLYKEGRVRAIGVSNYTVRHLEELLADSPVVPAVNQFEVHAFNTRLELVNFCQAKGIVAESYSPLSRGKKLSDARLVEIAARYGKSPAQVLIRWVLQHGMVVIPKSVRRERILENADVFDFELSAADMQALDGLDEQLHTIRPGFMAGEW